MKKKGAYWQTIDCGFEKFLHEHNSTKNLKRIDSLDDWEMTRLEKMYKESINQTKPIKIDKIKDPKPDKKKNPLLPNRQKAIRDILLKKAEAIARRTTPLPRAWLLNGLKSTDSMTFTEATDPFGLLAKPIKLK